MEDKYKTFWRRVGAGFIDGLIFLPLGFIDEFIWSSSHLITSSLLLVWFILHTTIYSAYSVLMHGYYGQTLGKMACGVKVLNLSENRLTIRQAVMRDSVMVSFAVVSIIFEAPNIFQKINPYKQVTFSFFEWILTFTAIGWFLIEVATMLTNKKKRALHDFIAGSVVVRADKFYGKQ